MSLFADKTFHDYSLTINLHGHRPAVTNFPCHVIGSATTAVGRFLLLDQLSETHCLMTYVIRNVLETFSDSR